MTWLVIAGMALLLFFNRYLFLAPRIPLRLGNRTRQFLGFAAPGMLTAICAPIIFLPGGELDLAPGNPYLLASLLAIGLILWTRSTLWSVLLSLAAFFILRYCQGDLSLA